MTNTTSDTYFQAGITALKSGDRAQAREWLLRAIDADETHERAWLWLSGAVDAPADRRVCLENVLVLNPQNTTARRGLAKLAAQTTVGDEAADGHGETAVLTPISQYDDVWEQDVDICAYCACELPSEANICPGCGKKLLISAFRYEKPSTNLHILWVLLVGIAQLYLLQALYDVIIRHSTFYAMLPGSLMVLFLVLGVGVYLRQFWAYVGTLASLAVILLVNLLGYFIPAEFLPDTTTAVGPLFAAVINPVLSGLDGFLRLFQLAAIALALLVAFLKAGPDFERVRRRQIAAVHKGVQDPSRYHAIAARTARRGEWATAVLHWQRAAANAPGQISFQRHLGIAYARLGFYQRSAHTLQHALRHTHDTGKKAELEKLLTAVNAQLNRQANPKETNHV